MVANVNVLSLVQSHLSRGSLDDTLGKNLGVSGTNVTRGLSAVVPTVLAQLSRRASTPAGATEISSVAHERSSVIYDLERIAAGDNVDAVIDQGNRDLSRLIGQGSVVNISRAVARFANIPATAATKLLGFAGPAILGVIGRVKNQANLDDAGVGELLSKQRDSIERAAPAGFEVDHDTEPPPRPRRRERARDQAPESAPPVSSRFLRVAILLSVLVLLGALAYRWLGSRQAGESTPDLTPSTLDRQLSPR